MMSRKLAALMNKRTDLLQRQSKAMKEILDNSINPDATAFHLNEVIFTATEHRELLTAIDAELERSRKSWWNQLFS